MKLESALRAWSRWSAGTATVWAVAAAGGCNSESVLRGPGEIGHVLRVQGDGGGSGTVTAPDASPQISCAITRGAVAGVCAMAYPANATIRLIATPNATSAFVGWTGACSGSDQCVVDMGAERAVTAAFVAR